MRIFSAAAIFVIALIGGRPTAAEPTEAELAAICSSRPIQFYLNYDAVVLDALLRLTEGPNCTHKEWVSEDFMLVPN